ncbi:MAG: PIG-L family deacetylase [Acidobacteriota bacterium]
MTAEQKLVPFQAEALRGEKLLVLAPHPDDEVIGCGGLIEQHVRERRRVRVLIATDGSAAHGSKEQPDLAAVRKAEAIEGLRILGAPAPQFLGFTDRQLSDAGEDLIAALRKEIREFSPDLIALPSPIEIHPDHVALTRAFVDLVQSEVDRLGSLAVCRVAFYEVSQPIRPNLLLDITASLETKLSALRAHATQLTTRRYDAYARGLNEYRAMTLPDGSSAAEAYFVVTATTLHTMGWDTLCRRIAAAVPLPTEPEATPVSVVVRTKDRPALLRQAIRSIEENTNPSRVIVVNDGGSTVGELPQPVTVIEHQSSLGRSEAMNAGVRAATTEWVSFLDDDDIYYADHLQTLMAAAESGTHVAYYTDAVSVFMEMSSDGRYASGDRHRFYARDFDRELLLFDNYIPLPTLIVRRDDFLAAGGFDPELDLFEDWDFLLRLAHRGDFLRIPRVTCEIRHYRAGNSVILASAEGSEAFEEARLKIWKRNEQMMTLPVIASVFSKQKARITSLYGHSIEESGRAAHLENDITRLAREASILTEQLITQRSEQSRLAGEIDSARTHLAELSAELHRTRDQFHAVSGEAAALRDGREQQEELIRTLYHEIERVTGLLDQVYRSRTWKLHRMLESARGKS